MRRQDIDEAIAIATSLSAAGSSLVAAALPRRFKNRDLWTRDRLAGWLEAQAAAGPVTSLDLGFPHQLTDLSLLSGLPLRHLDIDNLGISSLDGVETADLKVLRARNNRLTSLPAGLDQLVEAELSDNRLTSIDSIRAAANLTSLRIDGNRLTDLSQLDLPALETLDISVNPVNEGGLPDFAQLPVLTTLIAEEISAAANLDLSKTKLQAVDLSRTGFNGGATRLPSSLQSCLLAGNPVQQFAGSSFPELTTLDLSDGSLSVIPAIEAPALTTLTLAGNAIESLQGIEAFSPRPHHFDDTAVSDLSPLAALPLTWLSAEGSGISALPVLESKTLSYLAIGDTAVADLGPISDQPIREVNIARTTVRDVSPLRNAPLKEFRRQWHGHRLHRGPARS